MTGHRTHPVPDKDILFPGITGLAWLLCNSVWPYRPVSVNTVTSSPYHRPLRIKLNKQNKSKNKNPAPLLIPNQRTSTHSSHALEQQQSINPAACRLFKQRPPPDLCSSMSSPVLPERGEGPLSPPPPPKQDALAE